MIMTMGEIGQPSSEAVAEKLNCDGGRHRTGRAIDTMPTHPASLHLCSRHHKQSGPQTESKRLLNHHHRPVKITSTINTQHNKFQWTVNFLQYHPMQLGHYNIFHSVLKASKQSTPPWPTEHYHSWQQHPASWPSPRSPNVSLHQLPRLL